jgi:hypothetical protein
LSDPRPWRHYKFKLPDDVAIKFEEALESARVHGVAGNLIEAIEALSVEFTQSYNLGLALMHAQNIGIEAVNKLAEKMYSGFRCVRCEHSRDLHVHHITPKSAGGSNDLDNLVCICEGCHREIHSTNWKTHVPELKERRKLAHQQVEKHGHRVRGGSDRSFWL